MQEHDIPSTTPGYVPPTNPQEHSESDTHFASPTPKAGQGGDRFSTGQTGTDFGTTNDYETGRSSGTSGQSYGSHVPGSQVEAADRPSRWSGSTVQQDAERAAGDTSVVDQARSKAKEMLSGMSSQDMGQKADDFKQRAGELGGQASDQADAAMTAAGEQMHGVAQALRDRAPEGAVGSFAMNAADALEKSGSYLQRSDLDDVRGDVEELIRRYPMQSLAIGLGVGFLMARAFRR